MAKGNEGRSGHDDNVIVWMGIPIFMIRNKCSGSRPFQSKDLWGPILTSVTVTRVP